MVERRLGRGLDFFLSGLSKTQATDEGVLQVEVSSLAPNPHQPRRHFDPEELASLARSIRATGILQPILVRPAGEGYEIIAGERRWRAAQEAGLERIPALVREVADEAVAVFGLVENLQRADLNAIEKALALRKIRDLAKASQDEVARQVGLDRSTVTNFLRLLELPKEVQEFVSRGTITMGHARAILGLPGKDEMIAVAQEVVRRRLSVRQVEALVQDVNAKTPQAGRKRGAKSKERPVWVAEIEETLGDVIGAPVAVRYGNRRSKITIECRGREQFEAVFERLKSLGDSD
ncbi:MAG: ParB/RepB/Spo0J family partition protein [Planctomycetota bacterium]